MMMVAVPVMPMLDSAYVEGSVNSSCAWPVVAVQPVFQAIPAQYGQCNAFFAQYQQQLQQPQQLHYMQQPPQEQSFYQKLTHCPQKLDADIPQSPQLWPTGPSVVPVDAFDLGDAADTRKFMPSAEPTQITTLTPEKQWDNLKLNANRKQKKTLQRGNSDSSNSDSASSCVVPEESNMGELLLVEESERPGSTVPPTQMKEAVSNTFRVLSRRDLSDMRENLETVFAPDAIMTWPDMAREVRGRDGIIEHSLQTARDVPDLELVLENAVWEGERSLRAFHCVRGTAIRSHPAHPFFKAGKFVNLRLDTIMTFDDLGRVTHRQVCMNLTASIPFEPSLLMSILDNTLPLSCTPSGSRILQYMAECGDLPTQTELVQRFRENVWDAAASPHANHILQKLIVRMPPERVQHVCAELVGQAVPAAQHRTRCRVLERLIEHCPASQTHKLVEEVIGSANQLCKHAFGNFIVQSILEHGTEDQRGRLSSVILSDVHKLAKHKIASNVVRAALVHSPREHKDMLIHALTADPKVFSDLSHHRIGSFVVREVKIARGNNARFQA